MKEYLCNIKEEFIYAIIAVYFIDVLITIYLISVIMVIDDVNVNEKVR
jgi:hypothetical protein